jgi:hypothetical protein
MKSSTAGRESIPMTTPARYRRQAEDCIRLARTVRSKIERKILMQIAEQYRRLANHKSKLWAARELGGPNSVANGPDRLSPAPSVLPAPLEERR